MEVSTVILGIACLMLVILLFVQNSRLTKISLENDMTKDVMESVKKLTDDMKQASSVKPEAAGKPLTEDGIEQAVRHAGYVPDKLENYIRFMVAGSPYYIEIGRLPVLFVFTHHNVEVKDWDMDLFRQAAHLMADELIMVKAIFYENDEDTSIRVLVASLDVSNESFQDNLTRYIGLIEDGHRKMNEIYKELEKKKNNAMLEANPFLNANKKDAKVMS